MPGPCLDLQQGSATCQGARCCRRLILSPPASPFVRLQLYAKRLAPGPTGVQSLMLWGGCAGITAIWLVQP